MEDEITKIKTLYYMVGVIKPAFGLGLGFVTNRRQTQINSVAIGERTFWSHHSLRTIGAICTGAFVQCALCTLPCFIPMLLRMHSSSFHGC